MPMATDIAGKPAAARVRDCLRELCTRIGWPVGHAYMVTRPEQAVVPTDIWYLAQSGRFDALVRATRLTAFSSVTAPDLGTGLPRRVAMTGRPVWVPDVTRDPRFLRARLSGRPGIRTALGVPVTVDGTVRFVLEFFHEQSLEADPQIIASAEAAAVELSRALAQT